MTLSIVCVTRAETMMLPSINEIALLSQRLGAQMIFGAHGLRAGLALREWNPVFVEGAVVEEMLAPVLAECRGDYVLRLDDDEQVPPVMEAWLRDGHFGSQDSWFFPRYHLWPDTDHVVTSQPFFPDFQTRLTTREKAGRAPTVHAGSPYPSWRAPVHFEHLAFLLKTKEERRAITARYESLRLGRPFPIAQVNVVLPEDAKPGEVTIELLSDALQARTRPVSFWRENGEVIPRDLERELVNWKSAKPVRVQL